MRDDEVDQLEGEREVAVGDADEEEGAVVAAGALARARRRGVDDRAELVGADRLGEKGGGAGAHAGLTALALGRHDDDRDVAQRLAGEHVPEDVLAVAVGHGEIEEDGGGAELGQEIHGLAAAARGAHGELARQGRALERQDRLAVVDEQQAREAHERPSGTCRIRRIASVS